MHTKSLLALSTGGIAVLSTILFRMKIYNEIILTLSALAITLFLLTGFYCLLIFERNAERVEAELDVFLKRVNKKENQKNGEKGQKKLLKKKNITIKKIDDNLKSISSYAKLTFQSGIVCSVFILILAHRDLTKEGNAMNINEENVTPDPKEDESQTPDEKPDSGTVISERLERSFINLDRLRPGDDADSGTSDSTDSDPGQSEPDMSDEIDSSE